MPKFEVFGTKSVRSIIEAEDRHEAAHLFREEHEVMPHGVDQGKGEGDDGWSTCGYCEACGKVIFEDELEDIVNGGDCILHRACAEEDASSE